MESILNLQLSLFGSFINIKPQNDIVIQLLTNLKEENFMPGTVDIAMVDANTKQISSESRLQLVSEDKTLNIVFLQDRIDFNYNLIPNTPQIKNIQFLVNNMATLIQKVFAAFSSTTGNRLAFNCRFLLDKMEEEKMDLFIKRYSNVPSFFQSSNVAEWNMRFNNPAEVPVKGDAKEMCNRIVEFGIMQSAIDDSNAIGIAFDINTLADNLELRFNYENLMFFANQNIDFICSALSEIEG